MKLTLLTAFWSAGPALSSPGKQVSAGISPVFAGLWGRGLPQVNSQPATAAIVTPEQPSPPAASGAAAGAAAAAAARSAAGGAASASMSPGPAITEAEPPRAAVVAPAAEAPISMRELHARVSPAVVALVVSGGLSAPSVVSGVLVTASGLVLTSRRALAEAIDGSAGVAMVRSGVRSRATSRELGAAVPARLVAVSDELDLAVVEAMPAETVFYPHLPIVRHRAPDGSSAVAVGHAEKRGLWSATLLPLGPAIGRTGVERWLRPLPGETSLVGAGTPLVDGVGRIVALAVDATASSNQAQGTSAARMAVDAEGLLRFLLAANAPELRFAGVPPFRRPGPGEAAARGTRGADARHIAFASGSPSAHNLPPSHGAGAPIAGAAELEMPGVVRKGALDRQFSHAGSAGGPGALALQGPGPSIETVSLPAPIKAGAKHSPVVSFVESHAVSVTPASLDRQTAPSALRVDIGDAPERGARTAPVTVVEIGDYHAPETRDVEEALHTLTTGEAAPARLLWKDADRGDGADYHLPARAARAAGEQDAFWPMHDRLLRMAPVPTLDMTRLRKLARELDLDTQQFTTSLSSEGLASTIETDAIRAGRLPLLCTPAFVVNGLAVDGGSIAAVALRAAVDDELTRVAKPGAATIRPTRAIAAGAPIVGGAYDAEKMARVVAEVTARRASRGNLTAPATTASTTP